MIISRGPDPGTQAVSTRLLAAFAFLLLFLLANPVLAEERTLVQMDHAMWTARDGAPQGVIALAQGTDGTLWLGTQSGLFNFDGHKFNEFHSPPGDPEWPAVTVNSVLVAKDGSVWAAFFQAGVGRISNGHVTLYPEADKETMRQVEHLSQSADGSLWALANSSHVVRFGADHAWHVEPSPSSGRIGGVYVDSSDILWVAQGGFLHRRQLPRSIYTATTLPAEIVVGFSESPDGSMWMADMVISEFAKTQLGNRVQRFDRLGHVLEPPTRFGGGVRGILCAADGSIWISDAESGLWKIHPGVANSHSGASEQMTDDRFTHLDGLSSDHSMALLLDSDQNIWVANQRGLDRFRPAQLVRFVVNKPQLSAWAVCTNPQGEVWMTDVGQLYKVAGTITTAFPFDGEPESIFCEQNGDVDIANYNGVFSVHANKIRALPPIPGMDPYDMRQVVAAADHSLYAILGGGKGLWHYGDSQWKRESDISGYVEYWDSDNRLWVGSNKGRVVLPLESGKVFSSGNPGLGFVFSILETHHRIFAAGTNGLAVLREDHFDMLNVIDRSSARGVRGMVESRNGDLWLNAIHGVLHLSAADLERALATPAYPLPSNLLAEGEFVTTSQYLGGSDRAARDAGGNLWFSSLNGLFHYDPEHHHEASRPPTLAIQSITVDHQTLTDDGTINPRPQTLEIRYLGVNLTAPDGVIYKYQLDNVDATWQDAGTRTVAIYTKLAPGTYAFHVMASNGDGVWTAPTTSAHFKVLPSFYQTLWFKCLCAIAGIVFMWLVIRLRVRAAARAIQARAEARADERIRISRDLHDTLLQGIQGLLLNFHVAAQKIAPDSVSRTMMDQALASAERIIIEGRNRVGNLRTEHIADGELVGSLNNLCRDLNLHNRVKCSVQRSGTDAVLKARAADEVFSICREALTNAFRHSHASEVRMSLAYGRRYFDMLCSDNGVGFDVSANQKADHWGLKGMVERAEKLRGRIQCRSSPTGGTEIRLKIPAYAAYANVSRFRFYLNALRFQ